MNLKVIAKCISGAKKLHEFTPSKTSHYSFMVKKRVVTSVGYNNRSKTHPLAAKFNYEYPNLHSELASLINLNFDIERRPLRGYYMVNLRFGKGGELRNSRPCEKCQEVLSYYQIPIVYSTGNGFKEIRF